MRHTRASALSTGRWIERRPAAILAAVLLALWAGGCDSAPIEGPVATEAPAKVAGATNEGAVTGHPPLAAETRALPESPNVGVDDDPTVEVEGPFANAVGLWDGVVEFHATPHDEQWLVEVWGSEALLQGEFGLQAELPVRVILTYLDEFETVLAEEVYETFLGEDGCLVQTRQVTGKDGDVQLSTKEWCHRTPFVD